MSEKDELINEWIDKADHDLGSAKLIFLHIPEYFDTIAFHWFRAIVVILVIEPFILR